MREQKRIYDMNDRELRTYRRERRIRIARRKRAVSIAATLCLIAACVISYRSLTTSANTGSEEMSFKYYTGITVQRDETLWSIADRYIDYDQYDSRQDYIEEVCSINRLEDADGLTEGQRIIVPYYSAEYVR